MQIFVGFGGNRKSTHLFQLISLIIIIAALLFANLYRFSNYLAVPLFFAWIPYMFYHRQLLNKVESSYVTVSIILLFLIILYRVLGLSDLNVGYLLRNFNWIMAGVVSVFVIETFSSKELKKLFIAFTIILALYLVIIIRLGGSLLSSIEADAAVVVTYTWMGSMFMLLSGFCLILVLHIKSVRFRVLAIVFFLLITYLNFFILQRGTTAILTLAMLTLIVLLNFSNKIVNRIFIPIIIIFVSITVASTDLMVQFFDFLTEISPSERLAVRFQQLSLAIQFSDIDASSGSFQSRAELIGISWDTFTSSLQNFLVGVGAHRDDDTIIGNHSFIIDFLASYGILGGVFISIYFIRQYQIMMAGLTKEINYTLFTQCLVVFIFYVLRNFYGSVSTSQTNFTILLYFPLLISIILSYQKKPLTI